MKIYLKLSESSNERFILSTETVFCDQDTEKCCETFVTHVEDYGDIISIDELEDLGLDAEEILSDIQQEAKEVDDDGDTIITINFLPDTYKSCGSGCFDTDLYSLTTFSKKITIEELKEDITHECPEEYLL